VIQGFIDSHFYWGYYHDPQKSMAEKNNGQRQEKKESDFSLCGLFRTELLYRKRLESNQ
jgi:hypothetical protein